TKPIFKIFIFFNSCDIPNSDLPRGAPPAGATAGFGPPHAYGPSETGSFHLPPPVHAGAPTGPVTTPQPLPVPVRAGRVPPPPTKVTAGILTAALLCFALGIWALIRI
ncbi:hypothetical protein NOD94_036850, partial [Streptomyces sp. Isolate_45]|nr:hypothetical protein [Streptomyces sp. Isolate_45]